MILINLLPFLIEIVWDYLLIKSGKPDVVRFKHRAGMIAGVILIYAVIESDRTFIQIDKALIVAVLPFVFFDYALNKLRGLKWYHLGSKSWDKKLKRINPYVLLTARILVAVCLIVLYFVL